MRIHIPADVTAKPEAAVARSVSSQVTVIPDDDTAVGAKVMILVRFLIVFVIKVTVNPMLVKDVPTAALDKNWIPVPLKTPF